MMLGKGGTLGKIFSTHIRAPSLQGMGNGRWQGDGFCGAEVATPGVSDGVHSLTIITTLYDLVEAIADNVGQDETDLVISTVVSVLHSSRVTFLRAVTR
jgi:hypothetical protein